MNNVIVLAAGKGSRLKSDVPKIYHRIFEKELLAHISDLFDRKKYNVYFVINEEYISFLQKIVGDDVKYIIDNEQIGTGNSVKLALDKIDVSDEQSKTIILNGDCPLFTIESIEEALNFSEETFADLTLITAVPQNNFGYGRVVKKYHEIIKIVEEKDANQKEKNIREVNTGTYVIQTTKLKEHISKIENKNVQKEFYLTDIIEIFIKNKLRCNTYPLQDETEMYNINNRQQLSQVAEIMKRRQIEKHLANGITIYDVNSTYIGPDVEIEHDVVIYPNNYISGKTKIGRNTTLQPNNTIIDSQIGEDNMISNSVIEDSKVGNNSTIGPFAHIRAHSELVNNNRVGNFVEIKNSKYDDGAKSAHLSYLGDSQIGKRVNIGCGTITVNYDGKNKSQTIIGDDSFIGCNANLIAPITIGKNNIIAAGTTATQSTEDNSLVIGRSKEVEKKGYADNYWKKIGKLN